MNNFYQFGDKVSKVGKPSIGVVIRDENAKYSNKITHYFVLFENGDTGRFAADELKPVPHPDTARLDFLIERGEAAFKQNEAGNWRVYDPHSYCQMAAAKWRGFGNSPRAAIDAAMQQSE